MGYSRAPLSKQNVYVICGAPRSGTTWLHNALIGAHRFRGRMGVDTEPARNGLFVTDENQLSHRLLRQIAMTQRQRAVRGMAVIALQALKSALFLAFECNRDLLLKSPYYVFFLDIMGAENFGSHFLYIRRNIIDIAQSMLNHRFLRKQISGNYADFNSMRTPYFDIETRWISEGLRMEFERDFDEICLYDRALFKALCFASAFNATRTSLPAENVYVMDYESVLENTDQWRRVEELFQISSAQSRVIRSTFRLSGSCSTRGSVTRTDWAIRICDEASLVWSSAEQ